MIAVECDHELTQADSDKLCWLFGEATPESENNLKGHFVGPRREMITPWSTNAVEITQNMGLSGITRIEEYFPVKTKTQTATRCCNACIKASTKTYSPPTASRNRLSTSRIWRHTMRKKAWHSPKEEMDYLKKVEKDLGRPLTDSEVFGFAQINSEHCRHKIFGGTFIIDGVEQESSLFK